MSSKSQLTEQEIIEEKRRRQIATLKASNELLRQAKESALKHNDDPVKKSELGRQFDKALQENELQVRKYLKATDEEINNIQYRDADASYVEKYNRRLEKMGITDSDMRRKDSATVTTGKATEDGQIKRRKRRGSKKDESEIIRLENEEEIMKATMVKDDSDIEKQVQKNKEYEQEMIRKRHDKFEKAKNEINEAYSSSKINIDNHSDMGNNVVKVENKPTNVEKNKIMGEKTTVVEKPKKKKKSTTIKYDFDFSDIPSYVQYDVLPLPSNGQCYPIDSPLRCGRIPVAYLTASDENIIASPNAYRDGKIIDIILERKILDKRINIHDLCSGDRDAVVLWLRATSYGDDFPISATNPETGKQYNVVIKLSQFDYNEFGLESDDEGLFDYTTSNGDEIKFRFFTNDDEQELRNEITSQITDINKVDILKAVRNIEKSVSEIDITDEEETMLKEDIDEIKDIIGTDLDTEEAEKVFPNTVTEQMIIHTVSINGNNDREYIKNYIENMRSKDALDYRNYFTDNRPGVDFNFTVNIPESDGGGSFATFLRLDDTVFINF